MSGSLAVGGDGAGEPIPREYHRRVLKKIAQLTKVVYSLNTRNEDHESLIAALQTKYEARAERAESSAAAQLRVMGERVRDACEEGERRVREVTMRMEEEQEQLKQKQVSREKDFEELLSRVQQEHKEKVEGLVRELEQVSLQQTTQLRDIEQLREQTKTTVELREKELIEHHEGEMQAAEEKRKIQVENCRLEAEIELKREIEKLNKKHNTEVEAMRLSLRGEEEERGAVEVQRWQEREKALQEQLKLQEQSLAQRVSGLSEELRNARDQLAVARQRAAEMSDQFETAQREVCALHDQLKVGQREREELVEQLESLQTGAENERKKQREKLSELRDKLSETEGSAARLEADHRQRVASLQSQLLALQERVGEMERQRETDAIQHHSSIQHHSHSLTAMEQELSRLRKEKDALHSQYAREIEAAQALTGVKEAELNEQHHLQIQGMRQQHERDLLELRAKHEQSLEQLQCDLNSASELEKQSLHTSHHLEVEELRGELAESEDRLKKLTSELTDAIGALEERRRGLGEVEGAVERLKDEGRRTRENEKAARREIQLLKESLERLEGEMVSCREKHKEELTLVRDQVCTDTQAECTKIMKRELESLQRRMNEAHAHSTQQALTTLAQEKDAALSEAKHTWSREQSCLRDKIVILERRILELKQSSSLSLEEGRKLAKKQLTDLREEMESEKWACAGRIEGMERALCEEVERVRVEERGKGREEIQQLGEEWRRENELKEVKHSEELRLVREEGEREKMEAVTREQATHRDQLMSLQTDLEEQRRLEVARLQSEILREREDWARERRQLNTQKEIEVSDYRQQLEDMKAEGERRSCDLSHVQESLHSITEEAALLRKQIEVRGQELAAAKREASNILRCCEQELNSSHHAEVENMASQYRQQTQLLLTDFNKAKKMMTSTIAQLQRKVLELESLYQSRQSRPEDLELIRELQREVRYHQTRLKEVEAEKQVYQLELVNREKNYNKIFSASPCVGVLNPLSKKVAKTESSSRNSSAPSLSGKLPTLVNSSPSLAPRLTASDVEISGWSPPSRPRGPHQVTSQSPLTRRTNRDAVY